MIRINHLSKSFKETAVLDDVTLDMEAGKITALFGDSGSGKSTLSKILTGIIPMDDGEIFYKDQPLWKDGKYQRNLGLSIQMVYQQPEASLDPALRIGTQLHEVLKYHYKMKKKDRDERIREVLSRVGLEESILKHHSYQISGGEAQRISLVRAMLLHPNVLILDEATSMLDVVNQAYLLNWIKKEFLSIDTAVLFISHDKKLVELYAEKIYVIENKRIYEKEIN